MSKMKAMVCIIIALAFIVLISYQKIGHENDKVQRLRRNNRRLRMHVQLTFDPLFPKGERDQIQEKSSKEGVEKEYLHDHNATLNISQRLMILFQFIDKSPKDGYIDSVELEAWIKTQTNDGLLHQTKREMEFLDKDGDNAISFTEYLPQFTNEDIEFAAEKNDGKHGGAGWWMEQFKNADVDKNGSLDLQEFRDFLHPEDSNNEDIQKWLLRNKISQMDYDKDQKLNLWEFEKGAYESYKKYFEFENGGEDFPNPLHLFTTLDIDNNRFLGVEELRPMVEYLSPGELTLAKYYSRFFIREADDDNDGRLTLNEMLNHEHVFYNTVYDDVGHDDDVDDTFRDEL